MLTWSDLIDPYLPFLQIYFNLIVRLMNGKVPIWSLHETGQDLTGRTGLTLGWSRSHTTSSNRISTLHTLLLVLHTRQGTSLTKGSPLQECEKFEFAESINLIGLLNMQLVQDDWQTQFKAMPFSLSEFISKSHSVSMQRFPFL